ncbi:MAG: hypothetical protein UV38_C0002G0230 [candidate division TM6 bacterium GW2011_GWE2_42_60]|nr:MAG: hypothetical protein UV38_C0002G0230 [candidate division TM6 bacterium GW2011_GWE2_42_60]HBY06018.1 hypothetical protein [Candidatus Dependentiae bacterium]
MKKIFYPFTLITLALVCSHIGNAMDKNAPLNLKPLTKRLFSEVEESSSSSQTSSVRQNEQDQIKKRKTQQPPLPPLQTTNTSSSQNLNNLPQQNIINTVIQPENIQPQQPSNSNLLMSLLYAYLLNQQPNNTAHFNIFQVPKTQQLPQLPQQNFFEPQYYLSPQVLNGLFRQVPPMPQENTFQPNVSLNFQQTTVQSMTTSLLPSNFNTLVKKLFSAIEENDVKQVEALLKNQPANVVKSLLESKYKNSKNTPLHAATEKSEEMITLLLKHNAPTTPKDIWGNTPLQEFIKTFTENNSNDLPLDIIKLFLDKDPSAINCPSGNGDTLLHSVCKDNIPNKIAAIKLLISYGALVNTPSKNDYGETPFHQFIEACDTETEESLKMIAQFLTIAPDLATTKDKGGHTPLHYAARNGLLETTKLLVQNGVKIDAFTRPDLRFSAGYTPLHFASENGREDVITFLIEKGAQVNERTANNETPLHLATNSNHRESASLLIKNGANVNAKDNDGVAPIHTAVNKINLEIVTNLITQGAKVDEPTTTGCTPLLKAAAAQRTISIFNTEESLNEEMTKIIQTLINHGADMYKTEWEENNTALHQLVRSTNLDAIKFLAQKKVLNNVQNLKGETPLHIICTHAEELTDEDNNNYSRETVPQTVQILIENGAIINLQNNKNLTPLQCAIRSNDQRPAITLVENGATIDFIRHGNRNKPYIRNLPRVLSKFFQTQLKPEKTTTDCSLKNTDWLTDEDAIAQAFHSKKTITAKENAPVSTQESLLRKLTFCLFFTADEIHKIKMQSTQKNILQKQLNLTAEEYKLYMELFNSDPKEKRIRTLLGLLVASKDLKLFIQRLKEEAAHGKPFASTKRIGLTKHDLCINFTPR